MIKRISLGIVVGLLCGVFFSSAHVLADDTYGSGLYGSCQYSTCGISLSSSTTVNLDVAPGGSTTCTVQKDTLTVTTSSSTGYTVTMNDTDTANQMAGSNGGTINPASGTSAIPAALGANTWGYRVDNLGAFGAGPTSAQSNGGIPSLTFAHVPLSTDTAGTVGSSTAPADTGDQLPVWYGVCANASIPSGTYTDSVLYTAVIN